jgi:hypothetical protein
MHGDLRSRYLVPRKALSRGRYFDEDRRWRTVVPIRFVRACRKGHVGDIDWRAFVHNSPRRAAAACASMNGAPAATSASSRCVARHH